MASNRRAALVGGLTALRVAIRNARSLLKIPSDPAAKATIDYVYEFYVLMEFLAECSQTGQVMYVPGNGPKANSFPRKPAPKAGRPKFMVNAGGICAQVCAGTKLADLHGMDRAPDISLQIEAATDTPSVSDVIAILDAKFTSRSSRIDHPDFSQFARLIELLLPRPSVPQSVLDPGSDFRGNCLVTSGEFSTELDAELQRKNVREIRLCHPRTKRQSRPQ